MNQTTLPDYTLAPEQVPLVPSLSLPDEQRAQLKAQIRAQLKALNAVLVAHYYVDGDIQELAEETGGCVADSLEMARFGRDHAAQTLIVSGVRFMGETAKILARKAGLHAHTCKRRVFIGPWLPTGRFCRVHPATPRPHRGGVCEYLGTGQSISRLW